MNAKYQSERLSQTGERIGELLNQSLQRMFEIAADKFDFRPQHRS